MLLHYLKNLSYDSELVLNENIIRGYTKSPQHMEIFRIHQGSILITMKVTNRNRGEK